MHGGVDPTWADYYTELYRLDVRQKRIPLAHLSAVVPDLYILVRGDRTSEVPDLDAGDPVDAVRRRTIELDLDIRTRFYPWYLGY